MSTSSKPPNPEKGARYFSQLDQALCNGNWSEIQELARKTDKHAPGRKCFTLTARSEAQIASAVSRPNSAAPTPKSAISFLPELIPKLTDAIAAEQNNHEDVYVAKVCLAEVHWLREDAEVALKALPESNVSSKAGGSHLAALGWLEVCEVKASLIRVAALELSGKSEEVAQEYLQIAARAPGSRTLELRRWTERLLARGCIFMHGRTQEPTIHPLSQSLRCFLAWSDFWHRTQTPVIASMANISFLDIPRREVWRAYYDLLSRILQYGLIYNPSPSSSSDLLIPVSDDISDEERTVSNLRQRNALKRVEATYESLLLNETQFPKAIQTNTEVEEWVEQVVSNWKILSGSEWTDAQLGDGGKDTLSRGVLDILYRAATKTFHSTAILRQLFTVHTAVGEFDLAMHAFNSYVEIMSKSRARAEKTGKRDMSFDSDDAAILTSAEAVRILCRYGDREQGMKALDVGKSIQRWLGEQRTASSEDVQTNGDHNDAEEAQPADQHPELSLQPQTLAAAYRAIGISQAHWARLTYQADSRSGLQTDALNNLRQARMYDPESIETSYALALLLAETRDVSSATQVIKIAIASSGPNDDEEDEEAEDYSRHRQAVPLWHLLALCLTAKDDYEQGVKMCEAAFDQFGDATVLFGESGTRESSDSEKPLPRSRAGLADQMEGFEKEGLLQIKMSQLTFLELMESAEVAVGMSHELLGLYARLFGNLEQIQAVSKPPPTAASAAPSKIGGTLRSIAGSIRPKSARASIRRDASRQVSTTSLPQPHRNGDSALADGQDIGVPISITVTNEDGVSAEKSHTHKHLPFMRRSHHGDRKEHGILKSAKSAENIREKPSPVREDEPLPPLPKLPEKYARGAEKRESPDVSGVAEQRESKDAPGGPEQPLGEIAHNAPHDTWPPPPGHEEQPPRQDVRLPAPHPSSFLVPNARLPSARDRQHKISLLVEIWLFIAGLYLRAELVDDASAAIVEASKLVESFEVEVAVEDSSARRFFEKRWGGGKSVDELWADVWVAKSDLALARERPFEALSHYEQALAHFPDHADGIIGISNILMDIYEENIPAEEPQPPLHPEPPTSGSVINAPVLSGARADRPSPNLSSTNAKAPGSKQDPTPTELNRIAARDRAYMLLTNLTHLGSGWDNSEAWFTLARAHELSKQIGKAKQALWWVVELEENKPMRPWKEVAAGGFTM